MPQADSAVLRDLAPTGTLRVAVNVGNAALVTRAPDGALSGRIPEIAGKLAAALGVPVELVAYSSGGAILDDLDRATWDVAFLAHDPAREAQLLYSRPYAEVEATFAALAASPFRHAEDADQDGVIIATARNAAYELHLQRTLRHAATSSESSPAAALSALREGRCDLAAGIRQGLESAARNDPGVRVLDGAFLTVRQAIATRHTQLRGAAFVDAFLEGRK